MTRERVQSLEGAMIDHVKIENSKNAGRIIGLPDSPIKNITLSDVQIAAKKDFVIKDAENPVFENVIREIKPSIAPIAAKMVK